MKALSSIADLIFGAFAGVFDLIKGIVDAFMAIFDSFKSIFYNLFESIGIYDALCSSLDTLTSLANSLNSLIEQSTMVSTLLSFCAFDTLFTVVTVSVSATFGVLLACIAFLFVTIVPTLLGFLAVKSVLRLIRLFSAGVAKP